MTSETYEAEILAWRKTRDAALRQENGWLALAGLFWLKEGENRIGAGNGNDIALPAGSAPEQLGTITMAGDQIVLRANKPIQIDGQAIREAALTPDVPGPATRVTAGGLSFIVVRRGERYGLRVWDNNRPQRANFPGRIWYPVDESYRVRGRYTAYQGEAPVFDLPNRLGAVERQTADGYVAFGLDGRECRLESFERDGDELFLIFSDLTASGDTYPAGRYLTAKIDENGEVVLDFNMAYNPPCAFTEYATCTFPPRENHLPVRVEAGERYIPEHSAAPDMSMEEADGHA